MVPPVQLIAPPTVRAPVPPIVPPLIVSAASAESALTFRAPALTLRVPEAAIKPEPALTLTVAPLTATVPGPARPVGAVTAKVPEAKASAAPAEAESPADDAP